MPSAVPKATDIRVTVCPMVFLSIHDITHIRCLQYATTVAGLSDAKKLIPQPNVSTAQTSELRTILEMSVDFPLVFNVPNSECVFKN